MSKWINVGSLCAHCGRELEQRQVYNDAAIQLSGFEPMEYRHSGSHNSVCIVEYRAAPYDNCRQYEKWRKELMELNQIFVEQEDEQ